MIKLLLTTTMLGLSTMPVVYGDMFLDMHQDSNLSSLNDRHYSSSLGRFITPDKAKISISEYTYMNGNVIMSSDPSGLGLWSKFRAMMKVSTERSSGLLSSYDREVSMDGATRLKRENKGTDRSPIESNKVTTAPSSAYVIPDPQIGSGTQYLINSNYQELGVEHEPSEPSDPLARRLRDHQKPESNEFPPEYRPAWSKPSIYTQDDFSVTRVKGRTANISSDDDLGSPVGTASHRANRTKPMTLNSLDSDIDMTIENSQASEFNVSNGLVSRLTKNKRIALASGVVAVSVGSAALASYMFLKHKGAHGTPQPSPGNGQPCSGMTPHPAPC